METSAPVVWFELWVSDVERAKGFYGELLGWRFTAMADYDPAYWVISTPNGSVGGALVGGESGASGQRAGTVVYTEVAELAATLARVEQLGGRTETGPTDLPGAGGRFAIVRDPVGTRLGLWST